MEDPWPDAWRPVGEGEFEKEEFDTWWMRNSNALANLDPLVAEQWIYRHWKGSPLRFLDVPQAHCRSEIFSTERFLSEVHLEWGRPANPEHDAHVFSLDNPRGYHAPAQNWLNGTWTIPTVVLSTPNGVVGYDGEDGECRFLLIEGSKRYRYLNALRWQGIDTGPHNVFVLTIAAGGDAD
ncbi:MAG: hypothetical protein RLO80_08010 [Hyphomonas sp.]